MPIPIYYPDEAWYNHGTVKMDHLQVQLTYEHELFSLTPGFEYIKYKGESVSGRTSPVLKTQFKETGFYLLAKLRLLDGKLVFSGGGRFDNFELSNESTSYKRTKFTPSIGVTYSPLEFIKLRANYSEGFSIPNAEQIFGNAGWNYYPNPDLQPQENKTFEFGVDVSLNNFEGSLTYFYSNFTNKLVGVDSGIYNPSYYTNFTIYKNLAKAVLAGFEMSLSYDIGKALNQNFSLSPYLSFTWLTKRENKDTNVVVPIAPNTLPYTPKILMSYGINFNYPSIHLTARINANYVGKSFVQDFNSEDYIFNYLPAWREHGGFTVVDMSISKRLVDFGDKGSLELEGKFGNIFNSNKAYNAGVTMPGRNFFIGVAYQF